MFYGLSFEAEMHATPWIIHLEPEVRTWLHELRSSDRETLMDISAAIDVLEELGPAAGRPLVDKLKYTNLHNLKELRPGSTGNSEIRILFAFDEIRRAVFLIAGDKEGNWEQWYREAIPLAEQRFERHRREHVATQTAGLTIANRPQRGRKQ